MNRQLYLERRTLSWFYGLTALGVLILIFLGGMVTTQDAGLAVPDWPLSYGSLNPEGWWHIAPVRLEHSHRLVGMVIGLLVLVAMVWSFIRLKGTSLPWWSFAGFLAVLVQGIMGGLRVTEVSTTLAIIHGIFGQMVFTLLVCLIFTFSPRWRPETIEPPKLPAPKVLPCILVGIIVLQLIVAATMRHHNAGLVIPDFPLSNGRLIPEFTSWQVAINFTHRVLAFGILGVAIANAVVIWDGTVADRFLKRAMGAVLLLIVVQICLGIFTVWSIAAPVPTTLHVTNGAMVLASSVVLCLRALYLRGLVSAPIAPGQGIPDLVEAEGL